MRRSIGRTHTYTHTHTHIYTHIRIHIHVHTNTRAHGHTPTNAIGENALRCVSLKIRLSNNNPRHTLAKGIPSQLLTPLNIIAIGIVLPLRICRGRAYRPEGASLLCTCQCPGVLARDGHFKDSSSSSSSSIYIAPLTLPPISPAALYNWRPHRRNLASMWTYVGCGSFLLSATGS